jgi:sulfur-carrier protein
MSVRVRLFAAVREAAGTAEVAVPAGPLPDVLDDLRERFGQPFSDRLALCTVLLDGTAVQPRAEVPVDDGSELVLLPPVSGGARRADRDPPADADPPRRADVMTLRAAVVRFALAVGLTAAGFAVLLAGPVPLTVLVLAVAVAVLVDVSQLLARAVARPVLPVALVPGLVLPAMIAGDVAADPAAGWDRVPGVFAITFLLGFALVLVFGRRAGVVAGLSATMTASLLVGLGASGVLLLRAVPDGFTWLLGLALLVVAADSAGPLVRRVRAVLARRRGRRPPRRAGAAPAAALVPTVVAVAVVGVALWAVLGPPLEPPVVAALALIALVAAFVAGYLERTLRAEAARQEAPAGIRGGILLGVADAMLLAAPAGYLLARAVAL